MQTASEVDLTLFNSGQDSQLYKYRSELEKISNELIKFGLTRNQAKIFMYLGKYGSKTSREICKALNLPRTETYNLLNGLLNLGIITSEFQHPTKYTALPMDKAISTIVQNAQENVNNLAKKEIALAKLWNAIPSITDTDEIKSEKFQMLEGTTRINSKMKDMITNAKSEFKIFCTEKDLSRFYYSDFIDMLGNAILDLKLIVSPTQKLPRFIHTIDESKVRILPNNKVDNQCFIIKDTDEVIIFLRNANQHSRKVFAFWTDTDSLIKSMQSLFNYSWQNSLPLDFERYLEDKYN